DDASLTALSRPQGLSRHDRRAGIDDAARGDGRTVGATEREHSRRRRTVLRWLQWWRNAFTATAFWRNARASFSPPVDQGRLPATLFERFHGEAVERLIALLRFISPITGGKAHAF